MKYTREEHLAMAAALREAIPYLWNGVDPEGWKWKWVENTIRYSSDRTISYPLIGWLKDQLEGFLSLDHWLSGKHNISNPLGNYPKLQATRLAWMHHMIEVLEKE